MEKYCHEKEIINFGLFDHAQSTFAGYEVDVILKSGAVLKANQLLSTGGSYWDEWGTSSDCNKCD